MALVDTSFWIRELQKSRALWASAIRSSVDCLIAACAIRNGVPILHSDRDFDAIARFTPLQSRYVR